MARLQVSSSENGVFFRAVGASIGANGIALIIAMVGSVLLTRALGVEARGVVAWVFSLSSMAMAVLQFGIGQANRRFAAEDPTRAGDLALFTIGGSLVGGVLILPFFAFYAMQAPVGHAHMSLVYLGLAAAPIMAIATNMGEMLVGLYKMNAFNLYIITQKVVNCLLILFLVSTHTVTPATAVLVLLLSFAAQMLWTVVCVRREIGARRHEQGWIFHHLKSYMAASYTGNMLMNFSSTLMPLLVGNMCGVREAGLFAACMTLIDAARSSLRMVGMHTLPKLARTHEPGQRRALARQSLSLSLGLGALAGIALYSLSGWILPLLFGRDFAAAVPILRMMTPGLLGAVFFNTLQAMIASVTKGWEIVISPFILIVLIGGVSWLLIPSFGGIGAALAFAIGFAGASLVSIVLCLRHFR